MKKKKKTRAGIGMCALPRETNTDLMRSLPMLRIDPAAEMLRRGRDSVSFSCSEALKLEIYFHTKIGSETLGWGKVLTFE